jgi:hypothetical protein
MVRVQSANMPVTRKTDSDRLIVFDVYRHTRLAIINILELLLRSNHCEQKSFRVVFLGVLTVDEACGALLIPSAFQFLPDTLIRKFAPEPVGERLRILGVGQFGISLHQFEQELVFFIRPIALHMLTPYSKLKKPAICGL